MATLENLLQTLREHTWIDLTHQVHEGIPRYGAFPALKTTTPYSVQKDGFFVHEATFVTQYGTHIDAPIHFNSQNKALHEIPIQEFILPLFVINKEKEVQENPDFILSKQDILDFESIHGIIPKESFVAFSTGWSKKWCKSDFYQNDANGTPHTPGWSIEALDFLINQRQITAIGHETLDTDASCDIIKNQHLLSEKFILDHNKFQLEALNNLYKLPPKGGLIVIGAPLFRDFPGFPCRAFAIIPN